jgi:hypothetical protein
MPNMEQVEVEVREKCEAQAQQLSMVFYEK